MTTDDVLFENLAPPPGGAAALRKRLRRHRWRRRAGQTVLAGAIAALAAAGLHRLAGAPDSRLAAEPDAALIALGLQLPPAEPASVPPEARHRMALERVPLKGDRVVLYNVAMLPPGPPDSVDD